MEQTYNDESLFHTDWSREKLEAEYVAMCQQAQHYEHLFTKVVARESDTVRRMQKVERERTRNDRIANARHYVDGMVRDCLKPITGLIYRVENLGDRAGTRQVGDLKAAAAEARRVIKEAIPDTVDAVRDAWVAMYPESGDPDESPAKHA